MSLTESRYAIMEYVAAMDVIQTKLVLEYIEKMSTSKTKSEAYRLLKEKAMAEINAALKQA